MKTEEGMTGHGNSNINTTVPSFSSMATFLENMTDDNSGITGGSFATSATTSNRDTGVFPLPSSHDNNNDHESTTMMFQMFRHLSRLEQKVAKQDHLITLLMKRLDGIDGKNSAGDGVVQSVGGGDRSDKSRSNTEGSDNGGTIATRNTQSSSTIDENGKDDGANDTRGHALAKEEATTKGGGDEEEETVSSLKQIRTKLEGATATVDDQMETLYKMMTAKVDSLKEMFDLIKTYETYQKSSNAKKKGIMEKISKDSKMNIISMDHMLDIMSEKAAVDPFIESFNGDFVWKDDSGGTVFSIPAYYDFYYKSCRLDCPVMKIGWKYQWTVEIKEIGDDFGVGVVSSAQFIDPNEWLGDRDDAWVVEAGGSIYHNGGCVPTGLSGFVDGDKMMFTLDLSGVGRNQSTTGGSLSAKIVGNSNNDVVLCNNILGAGIDIGMHFSNDDGRGFYPAVSGSYGSRLKFVGFDSVE